MKLQKNAYRIRFLPHIALAGCVLLSAGVARAQFDALYNHEAIAYSSTEPENQVSRLQDKLASGEATLEFDEDGYGWLLSLLEALEIDKDSQMLVFSKTSLQRKDIAPQTPRALYFNDTTYIGYPNGGELIEISVADPKMGAVFYSIEQKPAAQPEIHRETARCLVCHASSAHTRGIPGHIIRSVFTDRQGFPELSLGSFHSDPESPVEERWGGWFVTGKVGDNPHLGNKWVTDSDDVERFDPACEKIAKWPEVVDKEDYPADSSDIAALLVLEHQVALHNALTRARFATLRALWNEEILDNAFDDGSEGLRDSTIGRIDHAATELAEKLFTLEAAPLGEGIVPDPDFVEQFASRSHPDSQGRSLRDFGLQTRLFRYPCSFLVYEEAFQQLPQPLKQAVVAKMTDWLINGIPEDKGSIPAADRKAVLQILRETHPAFAPPA